jgi:hypothetical protein
MTNLFYTIVHSTRSNPDFVDRLRETKVRLAVDVRTVPRFRSPSPAGCTAGSVCCVADNPAVGAHPPLCDQDLGLRAGAEPELRQGARQADHGAVLTPRPTRAPRSGRWFHDGVGPNVSS